MTVSRRGQPHAQVANDAACDLIRPRIVLTGGNGTGGSPTGTTAEFEARTNDWIVRPLDPGIYKTSSYFAAFIPTDTSLAGGIDYFQAAVLDGGSISVSNRGDATLAAL